ncbi:MAG: hypothetical protein HOC23_20960 [Halieaceae bacterium]|jgi:peptidyl-Asp metalloendopeptidase|nr:hypothetical protein [Halieaceae bacterium]
MKYCLPGGVLICLFAIGAIFNSGPVHADGNIVSLFEAAELPGGGTLPRGPEIIRSRAVNITPGVVDTEARATLHGQIALNLFDDTVYIAVQNSVYTRPGAGVTWIGHIEGISGSEVVLVTRGKHTSANITLPDALYRVRAYRGAHLIRQIDRSQFEPEMHPLQVAPSELTGSSRVSGSLVAADDGSIIDVLVVYTAAAKTAEGGQAAIDNLIDLAISETNTGYANSGVTQRVNLVHSAEVAYDESAFGWGTTLSRLQASSDGYMDNVHSLRDTYGADEVVLIVAASGACGIGYLMRTVSTSFASLAFSVVRYTCATGYYSFGHELGHNMGSMHDRANSSISGAYPYSYGYQAPDNSFRTIMAYNCSGGCTRRNFWSSPLNSYNGQPTGIVDGDAQSAYNVKSLNNTAYTVANFRQSVTPAPTPTTGPTPEPGEPVSPAVLWFLLKQAR